MFRDFHDDLTLVLGHWLKDERQAQLLIVILGWVGVWLPLELVDESLKSIELDADEIELVKQLVSE